MGDQAPPPSASVLFGAPPSNATAGSQPPAQQQTPAQQPPEQQQQPPTAHLAAELFASPAPPQPQPAQPQPQQQQAQQPANHAPAPQPAAALFGEQPTTEPPAQSAAVLFGAPPATTPPPATEAAKPEQDEGRATIAAPTDAGTRADTAHVQDEAVTDTAASFAIVVDGDVTDARETEDAPAPDEAQAVTGGEDAGAEGAGGSGDDEGGEDVEGDKRVEVGDEKDTQHAAEKDDETTAVDNNDEEPPADASTPEESVSHTKSEQPPQTTATTAQETTTTQDTTPPPTTTTTTTAATTTPPPPAPASSSTAPAPAAATTTAVAAPGATTAAADTSGFVSGPDQQALLLETQRLFQQQMEEMRRMTMTAMEAMAAKQAEAAAPTAAKFKRSKADSDEDEDEDDEPPPDPEDDMDNWRKQKTKKGRVYFYNTVTKKSRWKPPKCWVEPPPSSSSSSSASSAAGSEGEEEEEGGATTKQKQQRGVKKAGIRGDSEEEEKEESADDSKVTKRTQKRRDKRKKTKGKSSAAGASAQQRQYRDDDDDEETDEGVACPHCGADNLSTAKFCCECGRSVREVPKLCQMEGCRSFGTAKEVVYSCNDELLTRRNNGRTLYLCHRCGEMIKTFPLFENIDLVQIAPIRDDMDDGFSTISSWTRLHDMYPTLASQHTSFRGGPLTGPFAQSQADHAPYSHAAQGQASVVGKMSLLDAASASRPADVSGSRGPPGRYIGDAPDMTDTVNIQWYEMQDIPPEDERWGKLLLDEEEEEEEDMEGGEGAIGEGAEYGDGVAAGEEERAPSPEPMPVRPLFPVVSFGFGGQLVTVFPHFAQPPSEEEQEASAGGDADTDSDEGDDSDDGDGLDVDVAPGDSVSCQASEHGSTVNDDGGAGNDDDDEEEEEEESGPRALGCTIVVHSLGSILLGCRDGPDSTATTTATTAGAAAVNGGGVTGDGGDGGAVVTEEGEEERDGGGYDVAGGGDGSGDEQSNTKKEKAKGRKEGPQESSKTAVSAHASTDDDHDVFRAAWADVVVLQQGDVSQCMLGMQGLSAGGVAQLVNALSDWLHDNKFAPSKVLLCRLLAMLCRHGFPQPPTPEGVLSLSSGLLDQVSSLLQTHSAISTRVGGDSIGVGGSGGGGDHEDAGDDDELVEGINHSAVTAGLEAAVGGDHGDPRKREQQMRQMQALLLAGQREAACKVALEAGFWEHALILAWYTGPELHKRVVTRVADERFSPSHPLGVLYHAFAGHVPAPPPAAPPLYDDVTQWTDTLLAFLNNPTRSASDVVSHLARSLVAKDECTAHDVCRLLLGQLPAIIATPSSSSADAGSSASSPNTMLLARNHRGGAARTSAFANALAIKLTEVALFAAVQSSNMHALQLIPGFHVYLYWMAVHACECGEPAVALSYCEAIAGMLAQCSAEHCRMLHVSYTFLSAVVSLALRILASNPACAGNSVMTSFWTHTGPQLLASMRPQTAQQQHHQQQQHQQQQQAVSTGAPAETTSGFQDNAAAAATDGSRDSQDWTATGAVAHDIHDAHPHADDDEHMQPSTFGSGGEEPAGLMTATARQPEHPHADVATTAFARAHDETRGAGAGGGGGGGGDDQSAGLGTARQGVTVAAGVCIGVDEVEKANEAPLQQKQIATQAKGTSTHANSTSPSATAPPSSSASSLEPTSCQPAATVSQAKAMDTTSAPMHPGADTQQAPIINMTQADGSVDDDDDSSSSSSRTTTEAAVKGKRNAVHGEQAGVTNNNSRDHARHRHQRDHEEGDGEQTNHTVTAATTAAIVANNTTSNTSNTTSTSTSHAQLEGSDDHDDHHHHHRRRGRRSHHEHRRRRDRHSHDSAHGDSSAHAVADKSDGRRTRMPGLVTTSSIAEDAHMSVLPFVTAHDVDDDDAASSLDGSIFSLHDVFGDDASFDERHHSQQQAERGRRGSGGGSAHRRDDNPPRAALTERSRTDSSPHSSSSSSPSVSGSSSSPSQPPTPDARARHAPSLPPGTKTTRAATSSTRTLRNAPPSPTSTRAISATRRALLRRQPSVDLESWELKTEDTTRRTRLTRGRSPRVSTSLSPPLSPVLPRAPFAPSPRSGSVSPSISPDPTAERRALLTSPQAGGLGGHDDSGGGSSNEGDVGAADEWSDDDRIGSGADDTADTALGQLRKRLSSLEVFTTAADQQTQDRIIHRWEQLQREKRRRRAAIQASRQATLARVEKERKEQQKENRQQALERALRCRSLSTRSSTSENGATAASLLPPRPSTAMGAGDARARRPHRQRNASEDGLGATSPPRHAALGRRSASLSWADCAIPRSRTSTHAAVELSPPSAPASPLTSRHATHKATAQVTGTPSPGKRAQLQAGNALVAGATPVATSLSPHPTAQPSGRARSSSLPSVALTITDDDSE